jgi:MFS transporter, DHA1 family, inner membrane transport protein
MKKSIYIMALGAFGIITTEFGIIGIMPAIAKHFNVSIDTAGWLLSGFALTIALTGPFSVLLTSKINRKWMMCLVLFTFVLSNILSAVAPNFTVLMIARILPAFLHPVFWAVATVAASRQVEPRDAPKAVSVVLAGLSIATVLGVPLTTYIAELINWKASFWVSGVINLIAFAALAAFVPSMPVTEKQSVKSQLVILRKGQMWVNLIATMIMIAGIFATYSYLAEYLGKISSMNGKQISIMLLLFGTTGIAGNWVTGLALSKNVMLTTRFFLLSLIAVHVMAYLFGGLFIPMTAIVGIWGFIHTGGFLIGQTRSTSEAPEAPELAASLMVSFGNGGVTLGTFLGGIIIAGFGVHHVIWISILLLIVAFALTFVFVGKKATDTVPEKSIAEQSIPEASLAEERALPV